MSPARFRERYGPWAVVAGASEGIGAAYARELAARGLNLVLVARRAPQLQQLARDIERTSGVEVRALPLDLGAPGLPGELSAACAELEVGLLVYNAALSIIGPFLDQPLDQHLRTLEVNCRGPLALTHLFGRSMAQRGRGGLLLMSSMAGFQGSPWITTYAATRAYNLVLGEGLWEELRERGVDVTVCCAGATRTPGYVSSDPDRPGLLQAPVMEPAVVVTEALAALGRQPVLIPGRSNRLASLLMRRLLPRALTVRIMGKTTRAMYSRGQF